MPVMPKEDSAPEGITEKIAKNPSSNTESTASDHELHTNEHSAHATAQDFHSKGPVIPDSMPAAESKDELKARAEELNKD